MTAVVFERRSENVTLKIAVQMDPIASINPAGDSTFALMLEAQARKHKVDYYVPQTLALRDNHVSAEVAPMMVTRSPRAASTWSNRRPSSCSATSLKASVGPWNSSSRKLDGPICDNGATAG